MRIGLEAIRTSMRRRTLESAFILSCEVIGDVLATSSVTQSP